MTNRPNYIDLGADCGELPRIGVPSPRREYFDGEIPPALSPLDAFAAQGRMLARQLDESMRRDRRMSRLPPASVARSLSQPRSGYYRPDRPRGITRSPSHGSSPAVEHPKFRPQSEHPRLSALSTLESEDGDEEEGEEEEDEDDQSPLTVKPLAPPTDYFSIPRTASPEEDLSLRRNDSNSNNNNNNHGSHDLAAPAATGVAVPEISRGSSTESISRPNVSNTLVPPASPMLRPHSSSSRLAHPESSDDDYASSTAGSTFSKPRKMSCSSGISHSPMSPFVRPRPRSPSLSSETSNTAPHLPRPSFNFSRPLNRSSTSLSAPSPGSSEPWAPHQSSGLNRERRPSPITVPSHSGAPEDDVPKSAASSYIHGKHSLPRGRAVSRDSLVFSGLHTPIFESTPPHSARTDETSARTPSPPSTSHGSTSKTPERSTQTHSVHGSPERTIKQTETAQSSDPPQTERPTAETTNPARTVSKNEDKDETKSLSADSGSTVRPHTAHAAHGGISATTTLTAEEHVQKGIECHEKGSLQESTYHLRIAAKQNHPTAMLLYALACRHGWGMRPNPREGVQWLRKAVDAVGLDLADSSGTSSGASGKNKAAEIMQQKALRAQFALSIYELGVSHLNGWGVEQDKSLALRCFEIAAQWGDADAMAEAGYCYAEGIGCKKDLKKAAKFYRMAEANGMNMVGNSWYVQFQSYPLIHMRLARTDSIHHRIYKEKYMSDDDESNSHSRGRGRHAHSSDKKSRNKSRTRSLFGRKKSVSTNH